MKLYYTPAEAAQILGITRQSMYEQIRRKKVPFVQLGGKAGSYRIPKRAFDKQFKLDEAMGG